MKALIFESADAPLRTVVYLNFAVFFRSGEVETLWSDATPPCGGAGED